MLGLIRLPSATVDLVAITIKIILIPLPGLFNIGLAVFPGVGAPGVRLRLGHRSPDV